MHRDSELTRWSPASRLIAGGDHRLLEDSGSRASLRFGSPAVGVAQAGQLMILAGTDSQP